MNHQGPPLERGCNKARFASHENQGISNITIVVEFKDTVNCQSSSEGLCHPMIPSFVSSFTPVP